MRKKFFFLAIVLLAIGFCMPSDVPVSGVAGHTSVSSASPGSSSALFAHILRRRRVYNG
jgi:hypothetical protein